ncbi:MAG TPA: NAD(P)/FAD-dependent oxidoreductase [Rectinemataceae bacterium]|nr:NAD(P)/FAD-dependent oxidoreductase [Rectinemataceae bacterium]
MASARRPDADVIVVGAGSVGLLLSLLLARRGKRVLLLESRTERSPHSRAIGLSSPSIEILDGLGLAEPFIAEGIPVRRARVSDGRRELGLLDFSAVKRRFPFVLALPQSRTEALLEEATMREPLISLRKGETAEALEPEPGALAVLGRSELGAFRLKASFVVAADGTRGELGRDPRLRRRLRPHRARFVMGDFPDDGVYGAEARLFFTPRGSVESFPLPTGLRRWVLSAPPGTEEGAPSGRPDLSWLVEETRLRASIVLAEERCLWASAFTTECSLAPSYGENRFFLAGDAAHTMSPIVGQNMNTGFADAEWLAEALSSADPEASAEGLARAYGRARLRAARAAAGRAWAAMNLGAARGGGFSALRGHLIRMVLGVPALSLAVARIFTMDSIPGATLADLPPRLHPAFGLATAPEKSGAPADRHTASVSPLRPLPEVPALRDPSKITHMPPKEFE